MRFQERFTTTAIKEAILANPKKTADEKAEEEKKLIVSNDAYLSAEMQQCLIDKLEILRLGMIR